MSRMVRHFRYLCLFTCVIFVYLDLPESPLSYLTSHSGTKFVQMKYIHYSGPNTSYQNSSIRTSHFNINININSSNRLNNINSDTTSKTDNDNNRNNNTTENEAINRYIQIYNEMGKRGSNLAK